MSTHSSEVPLAETAAEPRHPLDPLSATEIRTAVGALRSEHDLGDGVRFVAVELVEPSKEAVLAFRADERLERRAFVVLRDPGEGRTYEAVVALDGPAVESWRPVPGAQPAFTAEEHSEAERVLKGDARFAAALERRGIADLELATVEVFPVNALEGFATDERRLCATLTYLRSSPTGNSYARPVEGVVGIVDLDAGSVVDVLDNGEVPLPPEPGSYRVEDVEPREGLRALEIGQPEGPSFAIDGNAVSWQRWRFRVGFTPREGLVLHTLGYEDEGRTRPIIHRASYSEMAVPYGDPSPNRYFVGSYEIGEAAMIGTRANPLELGCDCLGLIHYFDAVVADGRGEPVRIPNAICMHEEDHGVLWKHTHERTGEPEVRRSRRLVISWYASIGNYDYGFYWHLHQDGTIAAEVRLTGVLLTGAIPLGEEPEHGTLVAPQLVAPVHQHFFCARLDMDVDGAANAAYVQESAAAPSARNPHGNAFEVHERLLRTEREVEGKIAPLSGRRWLIVNRERRNRLGQPVGYRLEPGEGVQPLAGRGHDRLVGFARNQIWVTPFDEDERYAAGDYPNQNPNVEGLPAWTEQDRDIVDRDLVLWYSFGSHHVPRPEDWPVMPAMRIGFTLKPVGFFERNPALDVPSPHG